MITETREIYKCEHCRKVYQIKRYCESHEPKCSKNPINIPKCLGCKHLENIEIKFEPMYCGYQNNDELMSGNGFRCNKKEVFMYHPKLEHGDYGVPDYVQFDNNEILQERMPTDCDEWKSENINFLNN